MSKHYACSLIAHISIYHVTQEAVEWLQGRGADLFPIAVMPATDGVFIQVDDLVTLLDPTPEDLPASIEDLLEHVQTQMGAMWLRIDEAGERLGDDELPTYLHNN